MPYSGDKVQFNNSVFEEIMESAGVRALTSAAAAKALATAQANAPVDTGAYKAGLGIRAVKHAKRTTYLIEGTDSKTVLVEAQTGNLRKALKAAKL